MGRILPTNKLIQEVADVVLKDSLNDPRALVITNITDFFDDFDYSEGSKDFETVRQFQKDLFAAAWKKIKAKNYPGATDHDFIFSHYEHHDQARKYGRGRSTLLNPELRGVKKLFFPNPKQPFIDADDILIGVSYGPIYEVAGGHLNLFDFEQMMKDTGQKFHDVFYIKTNEAFHAYLPYHRVLESIRDEYEVHLPTRGKYRAKRPYDEFDPSVPELNKKTTPAVPIVFLNNQSLAYGVTPTVPDSESFLPGKHKFVLFRSGVKPYRRSSFWYKKAPYPFHTNWWYSGKKPMEKYPEG
ncbi:MAG: hypothetical protein KTR14_02525 [Vampirovibrio sp.]|nr:hypothetical protein [Vampirovibrio sp.]